MCTSPVSDFGQSSVSSRPPSEVDTFSHKSGSPTQASSQLIRAAVENNLPKVVSLIVDSGAQVNQKVRGTTALHESAKAGHFSIVQELITRRAEVNAVNRSGCTALHFATLCKDKSKAVDILRTLIDSSSQVNSTSERMDTPLHFAAYCQPAEGAEEVVRYLLSKRAMVNARNRNAESPLINAALNNNADSAKVLVEYNADIGQRTSMEKTAQDIAMERGCKEVVQVLEKMKDPLAQLTDTTALMRTALSQMQTVDMLSGQLRQQTSLTEAYESVAAIAVAELEVSARARLAGQALSAFATHTAARDPSSLAPAQVPLSQQQLVQALITLLLVSRTASGSALLHKAGVLEVMPNVEEQVRAHNTGHKELRELKSSLNKTQVELLELSAERSCSSTPSSITDQWLLNTQSIGPSTPSTTHTALRTSAAKGEEKEEVGSEGTIQCSETPSESLGDSAELGKVRKRMPSWSRKSGRSAGNGARVAASPGSGSFSRASSSSPRKNLPLIADDLLSCDEKPVQRPLVGENAEIAILGASATSFDSVYEAQEDQGGCLPGTASQASSTCSDNRHRPSWVKRWVDMGEGFSSNKTASPVREREGSVSDNSTEKVFDTIPQEDTEADSRENRTGAELIEKYREQARRRSRMCLVS